MKKYLQGEWRQLWAFIAVIVALMILYVVTGFVAPLLVYLGGYWFWIWFIVEDENSDNSKK